MTMPLEIKYYMSASTVTFRPNTDVFEAIAALVERNIPGAPVIDMQGEIVGIFVPQDGIEVALRSAYHNIWEGRVEDYMERDVPCLEAEMSIIATLEHFTSASYDIYPVVENNRLVGQLSRRDVLKALLTAKSQPEHRPEKVLVPRGQYPGRRP